MSIDFIVIGNAVDDELIRYQWDSCKHKTRQNPLSDNKNTHLMSVCECYLRVWNSNSSKNRIVNHIERLYKDECTNDFISRSVFNTSSMWNKGGLVWILDFVFSSHCCCQKKIYGFMFQCRQNTTQSSLENFATRLIKILS